MLFITENEQLSLSEKQFLTWYAEMHPMQRELIINTLISTQSETSIIARNCLSKWINKIKPSSLMQIENRTFFEERMVQTLTQSHFDIVHFECRTKSEITERTSAQAKRPQYNYFSLNCGKFLGDLCCVLAPNKVYQTVTMHVMIAKAKKFGT